MAQLTNTTFQSTPAQTRAATVRGARVPAEVRLVQALGRRVNAQIAATQQTSNNYQASAGGTVRSPGGEPLQLLRGIQATAATPVGSAVGYGAGIASGPNLVPQRETPPPPLRPVQFGERRPEATDARRDGDKWVNVASGALFIWYRQLGAWIPVGAATEAFPFRLDGQDDGTYVIDPFQDYPVLIEALNGVSGGTVTVSPAVGEVAVVGSAISITVTGSAVGTPVLGKLLLRRVG